MRVIPINDLREVFDALPGNQVGCFDNWITKADGHLDQIRTKNKKQRAIYWSRNNIWSELYPALSKLSGNKCWYSEAPESSSEWEIEHYRPKSQSKDEEGAIIRDDGYWWLSYHWENLRLAGSLVNRLRKDRFDNGDEVYGKGNFFPLNQGSGTGQPEDIDCSCERPLLIDPTKARDVMLISFDRNGEPYPTFGNKDNALYYKKAILSIKYYGLKHEPLNRGRRKIWSKCETMVNKAHNYIKNNINDPEKTDEKIDECFTQLVEYTKQQEPYTMVVRNFVKEKLEDANYNWLKGIEMVLASA